MDASDDEGEHAIVGECRLCKMPLSITTALNHSKNHHSSELMIEMFSCPICGKNVSNVGLHLRRFHHPDSVQCDICGKSYTTSSGLKVRGALNRPGENVRLTLEVQC